MSISESREYREAVFGKWFLRLVKGGIALLALGMFFVLLGAELNRQAVSVNGGVMPIYVGTSWKIADPGDRHVLVEDLSEVRKSILIDRDRISLGMFWETPDFVKGFISYFIFYDPETRRHIEQAYVADVSIGDYVGWSGRCMLVLFSILLAALVPFAIWKKVRYDRRNR